MAFFADILRPVHCVNNLTEQAVLKTGYSLSGKLALCYDADLSSRVIRVRDKLGPLQESLSFLSRGLSLRERSRLL